jgi:nucleoside phosphorylase
MRAAAAPVDVLVLAAFEPELEVFRRGLSLAPPRGAVAAQAVGIGLVDAALGAASALARHRPSCVVLLGTCGAFDAGAGPLVRHDVVVAERLVLADGAAALGLAAFVGDGPPPLSGDGSLVAALVDAGGVPGVVATVLTISTDDALATALATKSHATAEHLEAYAVAAACKRAGVPFVAVLGVANRVGSTGRAEWAEHHRSASAAAAEVALRWLAVRDGKP